MLDFFLEHPWFVTLMVLLPIWGIIELVVWLTKTKEDDAAWKRVRDVILLLLTIIPKLRNGGKKPN